MYGPVRTVMWEGKSRKAFPYPDGSTQNDVRTCGLRLMVLARNAQDTGSVSGKKRLDANGNTRQFTLTARLEGP